MKSIILNNKSRKILYSLLSVSTIWLVLILLAPILKSSGYSISGYLYFLFEPVCHQIPERSLFLNSEPLGVCTRCFAIYFGAFLFLGTTLILKKILNVNPNFMILLSVPAVIDFILEKLRLYIDIPEIRIVTGLLLGSSIIYLIFYSLLDINKEYLFKRKVFYGKSEIN